MPKILTAEQWAKVIDVFKLKGFDCAISLYSNFRGNTFVSKKSIRNVKLRIRYKALLVQNKGMKELKRKQGRPPKRDDSDIPGIIDELTEEQKREIIEDWIKEQRNKKRKNRLSSITKINTNTKAKILQIDRTTLYKKTKERIYKYDYLKLTVTGILEKSYFRYGSRKIKEKLAELNVYISDRTLRWYMNRWQVSCLTRQKKRKPESKNTNVKYLDLVKRNYNPADDNILATDVSYIPADVIQNFIYLSIAISHKTKMIESFVTSEENDISLVIETLNRLKRRNFIFHSDHGAQYSSFEVQSKLKELNSKTSMGRVGNSLDNREAEYFFSCLKSECLNHINTKSMSFVEVSKIIEEYINWYNFYRIQKVLKWKTPAYADANSL